MRVGKDLHERLMTMKRIVTKCLVAVDECDDRLTLSRLRIVGPELRELGVQASATLMLLASHGWPTPADKEAENF